MDNARARAESQGHYNELMARPIHFFLDLVCLQVVVLLTSLLLDRVSCQKPSISCWWRA